MEDITVKVPTNRVADFYEMFGRWLRGEHVEVTVVDGTEEDWRERPPWDPRTDLDLAKKAWVKFPDRAKQIFGTLIDNPGKSFTGDELAKMHAIPNGINGVAGVLAWPGRQLKKLDRQHHFNADPLPEGGSSYSMDPEMAELFSKARST